MTRIFIDTNIFLYSHDDRDPTKRDAAKHSLERIKRANSTSIVSTQVLQEFYNGLVRKLLIPHRLAIAELSVLAELEVVLLTPELIKSAAALHDGESLAFWDALIVVAAQSARCDELWSEDLQTTRSFGSLTVVNPLR